jgi:hypothetical protein
MTLGELLGPILAGNTESKSCEAAGAIHAISARRTVEVAASSSAFYDPFVEQHGHARAVHLSLARLPLDLTLCTALGMFIRWW